MTNVKKKFMLKFYAANFEIRSIEYLKAYHINHSELLWTTLWTILDHSEWLYTASNCSGPLWIALDCSGPLWTALDHSVAIWYAIFSCQVISLTWMQSITKHWSNLTFDGLLFPKNDYHMLANRPRSVYSIFHFLAVVIFRSWSIQEVGLFS